jgi:hypothetical protein
MNIGAGCLQSRFDAAQTPIIHANVFLRCDRPPVGKRQGCTALLLFPSAGRQAREARESDRHLLVVCRADESPTRICWQKACLTSAASYCALGRDILRRKLERPRSGGHGEGFAERGPRKQNVP